MKTEKEIEEMFIEGSDFLKDLNKLLMGETDKVELNTYRLMSSTMFARLQVMAWVLDKPDIEAEDFIPK